MFNLNNIILNKIKWWNESKYFERKEKKNVKYHFIIYICIIIKFSRHIYYLIWHNIMNNNSFNIICIMGTLKLIFFFDILISKFNYTQLYKSKIYTNALIIII